MDQILHGLFISDQPDYMKEEIVSRVCEQGCEPSHPEAIIKGVLQESCNLVLNGTTALHVSSGFKVFNVWGSHNLIFFRSFFTPTLVADVLTQEVGNVANVPLLLREGFRIMSCNGTRMHCEHAQRVQSNITKFVCRTQGHLVMHNVGLLFEEFNECIPRSEFEVIGFCFALLNHLSVGVPFQEVEYISYTESIAKSLGMVWRLGSPALLIHCLVKIFKAILKSRMDEQSEPTICMAAVVKYVPIEIVSGVMKDIVADSNVNDRDIGTAVCQIVEWLKWPTAQNVDRWLIIFITELAAAQKYTLLSHIIETNVEQVVENIECPYLRYASFNTLFHMLMGFQHSPGPFHKCLKKMTVIIQRLRHERMLETETFLASLSQLIYYLMHQHTGFPELYEPVLEIIKDYPQPNVEEIKNALDHNNWSSQINCTVMGAGGQSLPVSSTKQKKLEPGKTGLENLGNTCYMNSVIQTLYMCDQFRIGVLKKNSQGREVLLKKLQHVFAFLSQSHRPTMSPGKFLYASRPPWFLPGRQQDCSEFLKYLLNKLHEDEKLSNNSEKRPSFEYISTETTRVNKDTLSKTERKKKAAVMLTAVKKITVEEMNGLNSSGSGSSYLNRSSEKSLVQKTFKGKVQTTLRCLACGQESVRVESFVDIPLAFPNSSRSTEYMHKNLAGGGGVPNPDTEVESMQITEAEVANPSEDCFSVNDLISFYLMPEKLTGDNQYYCDRCGKLQDGERRIQIIKSPQYLILTLLRFAYDTKQHKRTKIVQDVHYPRTLSVPVCGEPTSFRDTNLPSTSLASPRSGGVTADSHAAKLKDIATCLAPKCENSNQSSMSHDLYSLSGVIVHSGASSECGHYYCYARHSQNGQFDAGLLDSGNLEDLDLLPDKWYNFNDTTVSHATFSSFSKVTRKFTKDTAYVLIYRKLSLGCPNLGLDTDFSLPSFLRDAVIKDNEAYLKEQETEARTKEDRRRRRSSLFNNPSNYNSWRGKDSDDDDNNPHGGNRRFCGGGFGNGQQISGSRCVY